MTQDELCEWLIARRAKEYPDNLRHTDVRCFSMPRMTDVPDCGCNEKPPNLQIIVFPDLKSQSKIKWEGGVEFEIAGQAGDGRWLNAKIYSCRRNEVADLYDDVAYTAKKVWTAFSETMNAIR